MKIAFMGTPALAAVCLQNLVGEHEVTVVVTQPDKPGRRGHELLLSPVKREALNLGLPVLQPERARDEAFVEAVQAFPFDAIAVVAYGQILPATLLDSAPKGCINLHFSLLPRWRGAAPVQYALWNGDTRTGASTQFMAAKLDAGDVVEQVELRVDPNETSGELLERLTAAGAPLLCSTLRLLASGKALRQPQDESRVTLAPTIRREQAQLVWRQPPQTLHNLVRAMNPWPTAWFEFNGEPLKVWRTSLPEPPRNPDEANSICGRVQGVGKDAVTVAAGAGSINLLEVQPPNKNRMSAAAWAAGVRLQVGSSLS